MKKNKGRIFLSAMLLMLATGATALHLPTTTINGRQYYYFKSKEKITVYGLSKRLGLTRQEIVEHNPSAVDGIKRGSTLYFPVDEFADRNEPGYEELEADLKEMDANPQQVSTMPVRIPEPEKIDDAYGSSEKRTEFENDEIEASLREIPSPAVVPVDTTANRSSIVLLLPFMLQQETPTRQSRLYTDFYKGFLIAADTLCRRDNPSGRITTVTVVDTRGDNRRTLDLLSHDENIRRATVVIVAPDDSEDFSLIAGQAHANGSYLMNAFDFRDTLYTVNPVLLQTNIPQQTMYAKAVDALMSDFEGYTPVILRSEGGRNEKEGFIDYLRDRYAEMNLDVKQITYQNALHRDALDSIADLTTGHHVFIPSSGSTAEFNKFAHVLKVLKESADTDNGDARSHIAVFGYPDWAAFRGDALDMLHALEATIYSRFYDDVTSFDSRNIDSDFRRWYGSSMIESVPNHGLLGYDLGYYLLRNLRANDGYFNPLTPYEGIQSVVRLKRARNSAGGYVNDALYIITYRPGGITSAKTI